MGAVVVGVGAGVVLAGWVDVGAVDVMDAVEVVDVVDGAGGNAIVCVATGATVTGAVVGVGSTRSGAFGGTRNASG